MLSVVVDDTRDPAWNLALDEALARAGEPLPVLRIWQNAPSVILGRFQDVSQAVDLTACARDGVRVVRRATGGGAVYTEAGTLNVTLIRSTGPNSPDWGVRPDIVRPGYPRHGMQRRPPEFGARPDLDSSIGPRSGVRPDLDVLVATAVEGFGLPAAALRNGIIQVARLRTRRVTLTHAAVHVTPLCAYGPCYVAPGGGSVRQRTLAEAGAEVTLDAVRAAILCAVVEEYGIACTRRPSAAERALRDHFYGVRYGDVTWHLTGALQARRGSREFTGR
jgi:lipoate-protein ligase A